MKQYDVFWNNRLKERKKERKKETRHHCLKRFQSSALAFKSCCFYSTVTDVTSEVVCWGIRNVRSLIKVLQHALFCMFVTAVCVLFLLNERKSESEKRRQYKSQTGKCERDESFPEWYMEVYMWFFFIQLFRERLSEKSAKVHATIPKGTVGIFREFWEIGSWHHGRVFAGPKRHQQKQVRLL